MRTQNALIYTLDIILKIALGYKCNFEIIENNSNELKVEFEGLKMTFKLCNDEDFQNILTGQFVFQYIDSFDSFYKIPIINLNEIFFYSKIEKEIIIRYDILSLSFILLSNLDEYLSNQKDDFDRFPFKNSISNTYDLMKTPIVDEYSLLLRKVIVENYSFITILPRKTNIIPTHDIDAIFRYTSFVKSLKSILIQIYLDKRPLSVFNNIFNYFRSFLQKKEDPYFKGILKLLDVSREYNLKSVFFFMSAKQTQYDTGYSILNKELKFVFEKIFNNKMLLGIHPGFYTYKDKVEMLAQKSALSVATQIEIINSRQHYLRFDRKITFDILQESAIRYDYTMGFAEEEGFRCGTAHPYHPYNFKKDAAYDFVEKPLIVMDVTLSNYKRYNVNEALNVLEKFYKIIKRTEGDFVILWHNDNVYYRDVIFFEKTYLKFLKNNT